MRIFLVIILIIATIWDSFTTIYGTIGVLGDGPMQILASVLFSAMVLGFLLSTGKIYRRENRGGFVYGLMLFFWFISLLYDFYTSYLGNVAIVAGGEERSFAQFLILAGLTLLGTSSPLLISAMWGYLTGSRRGDSQRRFARNA